MTTTIIDEHLAVIQLVKESQLPLIETIGKACLTALSAGHTLFFMGNGGSAADSQHLAAEFVGRFQTERQALPAMAFTTDTSILTAVGNDYGFDQIFARQAQAFVKAGDVVFGFSTSGNSSNVLQAMAVAKKRGAVTIGMTAAGGGKLKEVCDLCFCAPSTVTARAQEVHILVGHMLCQYVDEGV